MSETQDHQIRLFGNTIQLQRNDAVSAAHHHNSSSSNGSASPQSIFYKDSVDLEVEHVSSNSLLESINEDNQPKSSTEDNESIGSLDKPLKKPTKIIPCPRCESTDTKFCYFNNYNANQPRHFCKNCQRYWTAGGSMRNMPVGAGRRKNKTTVCSTPLPALETRHEPEPFAPQLHGFSGPLWASPWTAAQPHGFGFPVPIYAGPPYWDCRAMASWNMAWMPQTSDSGTLRPSSPLGKHPRDRNKTKTSNKEHHATESTVLVPKTLRIDDPTEAAKSSIWTTLGIKSHKNTSCSDSGAFFGRFRSKGEESSAANESSRVLNANPAALSRSLTFHESAE